MAYFLLKTLVSGLLIAAVSELAKRHGWLASIVASFPLTSILAMTWLYRETDDVEKVAQLSTGIFWMVLPSLGFFLIFPSLLRQLPFAAALLLAMAALALLYLLYTLLLAKLGIRL